MRANHVITTTLCLGALIAPTPALAAGMPAEAAATQTISINYSVSSETTGDLASNYSPEAGDYVVSSVVFQGEEAMYSHSFSLPKDYSGHTVMLYVEHANGNTEKLKRTVPDGDDPSVQIAFPINGKTLVTVVIDLWDKSITDDLYGPSIYYDKDDLQRIYDEFNKRIPNSVFTLSTNTATVQLLTESSPCAFPYEDGTPVLEEVPTLPNSTAPSQYAENYRPPTDNGICIGTYRYAFRNLKPSMYDDFYSPTAGFKITIDEKYAGKTAKVFIGTNNPIPQWGLYSPMASTHRVVVKDDGTITVPYGMFSPMTHTDESGESSWVYFQQFNLEDYINCRGLISINIESPAQLNNGVEINYNYLPRTVTNGEKMKVSISDSSLPLLMTDFSAGVGGSITGYEPPESGGFLAGRYDFRAIPLGENGEAGHVTLKVELGKEYAGRKATVYLGKAYAPDYVEDIATYTIDDEGAIYISQYLAVRKSADSDGILSYSSAEHLAIINVGPAKAQTSTDISEAAAVESIPDQEWTGSPIEPAIVLTVGEKTLTEGADYDLSYENNVDPGIATVVITGKGNYSGELRISFKIVRNSEPSNPSQPGSSDDEEDADNPDYPVFDTSFSDVAPNAWYYEAVYRAHELGIMNGYDNSDRFGPNDPLAREQAAAVLYNLLGDGDDTAQAAPHSDVRQGEWYSLAVNWAIENNIMSGYSGSTEFGIGDPLTREQFAAVIANVCKADISEASHDALKRFPDYESITNWATDSMAWAVESGVINGVELPNSTRELRPTETMNRAQMAAMIVNAIDKNII